MALGLLKLPSIQVHLATSNPKYITVTDLSCCQRCERAAFPLSVVPWMLLNFCMATQSKRCIYKQSLMQSLFVCLFPSADIGVQIQPMRTALISGVVSASVHSNFLAK